MSFGIELPSVQFYVLFFSFPRKIPVVYSMLWMQAIFISEGGY
jgi:hypothetical protein